MNKAASELSNIKDGWDWEWLYFTAKYFFHLKDEDFWRMTPRKYFSLLIQYSKFMQAKYGGVSDEQNKQTNDAPVYMDQLF